MVETHDHFIQRLNAHGNKRAKIAKGYRTRIDSNGLLVAEPRRSHFLPSAGVLKLVMVMLIGFLSFKSLVLAAYGPVTYNERLAKLENGTMIEKIGAKALKIDPVTEAVANSVGPVMR
ncbi:hypothetical protein AB2B41_06560 [Marimonas sp. MJW-29]|uniref:Uncharacterized protein n=1 Tax=Sulfitobacter sediminis TaxID=3234186 RepID=A0ABV3RJV1_9RHOB